MAWAVAAPLAAAAPSQSRGGACICLFSRHCIPACPTVRCSYYRSPATTFARLRLCSMAASAAARTAQGLGVGGRHASTVSKRPRALVPSASGASVGTGALRQAAAPRFDGRRSAARLAVVRRAGGARGRCTGATAGGRRRPASALGRRLAPAHPAKISAQLTLCTPVMNRCAANLPRRQPWSPALRRRRRSACLSPLWPPPSSLPCPLRLLRPLTCSAATARRRCARWVLGAV